jgi:tRNA threonylcarbamoyladenosine biosynthesis protein TsaB
MIYQLLIDTALPEALTAITADGQPVSVRKNSQQNNHASFLHPAIAAMLEETGITPAQLQSIAVTTGPGSYTGIRIGLAAAKGLCLALNIPLIGIHNLALIAHAVYEPQEEAWICPMIDARRMEVFTAVYDASLNEILQPQAKIIDSDSFKDILDHNKVVFTGNGSDKVQTVVHHPNAIFKKTPETDHAFFTLAFNRFLNGKFENPVDISPVYAKEFYNM